MANSDSSNMAYETWVSTMSEQARLRRQRFSRVLFMLFKRGRCEGRVLPRVSLSRRRHGGRSGGGRRGIFRGAFPHQEAQLRLYLEAGQGVFLTYQAFFIQQAHCPSCPLSARGSGKCAWNCRKQAANHEKDIGGCAIRTNARRQDSKALSFPQPIPCDPTHVR